MMDPDMWRYILFGALGGLCAQLLWNGKAVVEWLREEYLYRKGGLQVWLALRKERKEQPRG